MDTRTIERVQNFANQIERKLSCNRIDAFNLAIQMWKADSLNSIKESLIKDGSLINKLDSIDRTIMYKK